jgi:hypothetical protein
MRIWGVLQRYITFCCSDLAKAGLLEDPWWFRHFRARCELGVHSNATYCSVVRIYRKAYLNNVESKIQLCRGLQRRTIFLLFMSLESGLLQFRFKESQSEMVSCKTRLCGAFQRHIMFCSLKIQKVLKKGSQDDEILGGTRELFSKRLRFLVEACFMGIKAC